MVHPYAHPQHMKVLNHFIHIQYGCGMQSVVVYSLINDITMSFGPRLTTIFQNLAPPAGMVQAWVGPFVLSTTLPEGYSCENSSVTQRSSYG